MRKDPLMEDVFGDGEGEEPVLPGALYNTDFKTSVVGGYDKKEVDVFVERAGGVFEALLAEIRNLKREIDGQRERLESAREMEQTLRNALITSQKFHEETVGQAEREAALIREEAQVVLAQAQRQARDLPEELHREIRELEDARNRLRSDLNAVLDTHRALLARLPQAKTTPPEPAQPREMVGSLYRYPQEPAAQAKPGPTPTPPPKPPANEEAENLPEREPWIEDED